MWGVVFHCLHILFFFPQRTSPVASAPQTASRPRGRAPQHETCTTAYAQGTAPKDDSCTTDSMTSTGNSTTAYKLQLTSAYLRTVAFGMPRLPYDQPCIQTQAHTHTHTHTNPGPHPLPHKTGKHLHTYISISAYTSRYSDTPIHTRTRSTHLHIILHLSANIYTHTSRHTTIYIYTHEQAHYNINLQTSSRHTTIYIYTHQTGTLQYTSTHTSRHTTIWTHLCARVCAYTHTHLCVGVRQTSCECNERSIVCCRCCGTLLSSLCILSVHVCEHLHAYGKHMESIWKAQWKLITAASCVFPASISCAFFVSTSVSSCMHMECTVETDNGSVLCISSIHMLCILSVHVCKHLHAYGDSA